jgi:hypothetical protein
MPAFTSPNEPGVPAPEVEKLTKEKAYDSSTVSSKKVPLASLLSHVEGYPWSTQYYSQVLGEHDEPKPQGLSIDPTLQQYHLIRDFEIRVTEPLTYDFTKERRSNRLEGSGIIYPGLVVPCRGDMFIGDVGDGEAAIFTLLDVTPMSYLSEKCYEVSYRMTSQLTQDHTADLERKVVKTSHYVKDFLIHGRDPILSTDAVSRKQRLDNHGHHLLEMFNREFISPEHRYLTVPSQEHATFDAYVAAFMQRFINVSQHKLMREANWPEVHQLRDLRATTLWDLLLDQQPIDTRSLGTRLSKRMAVVDTWAIRQSPYFGGLYYSAIKRLIWPNDRVGEKNLVTYELDESQPRNVALDDTLNGVQVDLSDGPSDDQPVIHAVKADDYYVFSQAFYEHDVANLSWLEHLTLQMLAREPVATDVLVAVCDKAYGWGTLERFYYTPVLLMLIHYAALGVNG